MTFDVEKAFGRAFLLIASVTYPVVGLLLAVVCCSLAIVFFLFFGICGSIRMLKAPMNVLAWWSRVENVEDAHRVAWEEVQKALGKRGEHAD